MEYLFLGPQSLDKFPPSTFGLERKMLPSLSLSTDESRYKTPSGAFSALCARQASLTFLRLPPHSTTPVSHGGGSVWRSGPGPRSWDAADGKHHLSGSAGPPGHPRGSLIRAPLLPRTGADRLPLSVLSQRRPPISGRSGLRD